MWRRPSHAQAGVYVFLKETFLPAVGFLWGWAMFWSMHSGIVAAIAVVVGRYVDHFVPLEDPGIRAVAVAAILLLSLINYFGVRQGRGVQTLFTMAKVMAIVVMLVLVMTVAPARTDAAKGRSDFIAWTRRYMNATNQLTKFSGTACAVLPVHGELGRRSNDGEVFAECSRGPTTDRPGYPRDIRKSLGTRSS